MAKRKTPELNAEAQAANLAGDAMRKKEKTKRAQNNEKQKRFRENMKAVGYRQVLLWALPCPADERERMTVAGFRQVPAWEKSTKWEEHNKQGKIKIASHIHESSIEAAARIPEVKKILASAIGGILNDLEKCPESNFLFSDIRELLKPLGDPWGDTE